MNAVDYLDTLIWAQRQSSVPVQVSELELLRLFILMDKK